MNIPFSRALASTRCVGSTAASSSEVSLPSFSPNPPGRTKSRCMSMMISAVVFGLNFRLNGSALIVASLARFIVGMAVFLVYIDYRVTNIKFRIVGRNTTD